MGSSYQLDGLFTVIACLNQSYVHLIRMKNLMNTNVPRVTNQCNCMSKCDYLVSIKTLYWYGNGISNEIAQWVG